MRVSAIAVLIFLVPVLLWTSDSHPEAARAQSRRSGALTGEQIYRAQCASCHGVKGEGTKHYQKPLTGSQTIEQLARFIHTSMPPGPRKCSAPDAKKVASYIYHAFYSPIAQARVRPARIELSRLTVRQYRNAVMDLIGSFRGSMPWTEQRGLRARYYQTKSNAKPALERIDPVIHFDFGTTGAIPEQKDPYQFTIHWEGSLIAPETGEYEFILRTEHAAQLWINNRRRPLIDALVRSGNDNEYRGTIFLVGGRVYPLRLEFSKGVQGVDDLSKVKQKPPTRASLSLQWRRPKLPAEVVPHHYLMPVSGPELFAPTTPFPPDDRSIGYERGTSVSREWNEATTEAAYETAGYVASRLSELAGAPENAPDRKERVLAFCRRFVERAFRRPLAPELEEVYVQRHFRDTSDLETAVKRVVILTLKSPRFLFREIGGGQPDAFAVAERLSFGLWDSLPDEILVEAARTGQLSTREQVVRQAQRMAADPRAWAKLRDFLLQWLKVEHYPDLARNPRQFPEFNDAVAVDLRNALELFLEQVVWQGSSSFRDLLLTDKVPLNGRLAKVYGASLPPDSDFQMVALDPGERAGILTHPYLMASFAYFDSSSPIHRGVLISRSMLGRVLQPPPVAVAPVPADLHPKLTTRQRVALQTKPAACMSCHDMINSLGFTLEKFDAIGRFRTTEKNQQIDDSGAYKSRSGQTVAFSGARSLAQFLAESDESHTAFVEKLFHYLIKQPIRAYGPTMLQSLTRSFQKSGLNIRQQMVETVVEAAFAGRAGPSPALARSKEAGGAS